MLQQETRDRQRIQLAPPTVMVDGSIADDTKWACHAQWAPDCPSARNHHLQHSASVDSRAQYASDSTETEQVAYLLA